MATLQELAAKNIRDRALQSVAGVGLLGIGAGAGMRSLQGLFNLGRRNIAGTSQPVISSHRISLQAPSQEPEEDEEKKQKKFAESGAWDMAASGLGDALRSAWRVVSNPLSSAVKPIGRSFKGENITRPTSWPPAIPLAILAGGAGTYGGYKLTDMVLDRRRKKELESRLEKARTGYEQAIGGRSKTAQALDRLYDLCVGEKSADWTTEDTVGTGIGGALSLAGLLAALSGTATYQLTKSKSPKAVIEKAKRRRQQALHRYSTPPIYASLANEGPVKVSCSSGRGLMPMPKKKKYDEKLLQKMEARRHE